MTSLCLRSVMFQSLTAGRESCWAPFHAVSISPATGRLTAEAAGNHLARSLTTLPPNLLTPGEYRRRIALLARQQRWQMSTLDSRALRRLKAGAFLAVAQGSAQDDAAIVRLRYTPPRARKARAIALVGKGICFDTGGMNLKSAKHMHGMHEDMEGSFLARARHLAALQAAAGHLAAAAAHIAAPQPPLELFAEELREAQGALSRITGEFTADDLLGAIFSRFCIGK